MAQVSLNNDPASGELRRQFILTQIELQEAEDARDELKSQLAGRERLLAELQATADQALRDFDELQEAHRGRSDQRDALQQQLHVTGQAFEEARSESIRLNAALGLTAVRERELRAQIIGLEEQLKQQAAQMREIEQQGAEKDRNLREVQAGARDLLARIDVLEAEARVMKTSWSWRWTGWIRSLDRGLSRVRRP